MHRHNNIWIMDLTLHPEPTEAKHKLRLDRKVQPSNRLMLSQTNSRLTNSSSLLITKLSSKPHRTASSSLLMSLNYSATQALPRMTCNPLQVLSITSKHQPQVSPTRLSAPMASQAPTRTTTTNRETRMAPATWIRKITTRAPKR